MSNRFGHDLFSSFDMKKHLAVQEVQPIPPMSDHFYFVTSHWLKNYRGYASIMNIEAQMMGEAERPLLLPPAFEEARIALEGSPVFPKHEDYPNAALYAEAVEKAKGTISKVVRENYETQEAYEAAIAEVGSPVYQHGYSKILTFKIDGLMPGKSYERSEACVQMSHELYDLFGLRTAEVAIKNDQEETTDVMFSCLPGEFVVGKDASGQDQWVEKARPEATIQFFAYLVAKGLVDPHVLGECSIGIGPRGARIEALAQQLRAQGIEPIVDTPLFKATGTAGLPYQPAPKNVSPDEGYGPEDAVISEKAFEHQPYPYVSDVAVHGRVASSLEVGR